VEVAEGVVASARVRFPAGALHGVGRRREARSVAMAKASRSAVRSHVAPPAAEGVQTRWARGGTGGAGAAPTGGPVSSIARAWPRPDATCLLWPFSARSGVPGPRGDTPWIAFRRRGFRLGVQRWPGASAVPCPPGGTPLPLGIRRP
jgi:hypothetical protein